MKKSKKPTRRERIAKQLVRLRRELDAFESAETRKENAALIGRCFKFLNSYSCPESDADRWWTYQRVTHSNDSGLSLRALLIEVDKDGKVRIEPDAHFYRAGWTEIPLQEFLAAQSRVRKAALAALKPSPAPGAKEDR